jgi:2-polyprenyl-3-methyl-5-hydroxy-6-metoxy-1,4-benzoquinol methylase/uncharacterized protein YbaR (Trm112 family)
VNVAVKPVLLKETRSLMINAEAKPTDAESLDSWYSENLVCPIDRTTLEYDGKFLVSMQGRRYPVIEGIPVLLIPDEAQTIGVAQASIDRANGRREVVDVRAPELYLESLGISEKEKLELISLYRDTKTSIDPVVIMLIGATCGNAYKDLVGDCNLAAYPIPAIDVTPSESGNTLLDVGCNWGRWSVAAARKGFSVAGIDPSLGAVMAARRVAKQLNLEIKYLVADGRFLPFRDHQFDFVYSYSVLQHLSKTDARRAISQIGRVLRSGGMAKVQMANKWGIRSIQYQAFRRFREPKGFEVRYWSPTELQDAFSNLVGKTLISADCYLGLGWQWCDFRYLTWRHRAVLIVAELLRQLSRAVRPLRMAADSVFCTALKLR